jgi:Zn-dependent protease with chaperone function
MTHDQYAALVARLESLAARHPVRYRVRVGALAVLGYGYFVFIVALLVALLGLIAGIVVALHGSGAYVVAKLALPVVVLLGALGRALWVRLDPPEGRVLRRDEVPALFGVIESVRRAARAPAPHRVLLTDQMNAAVSQVPRLGIFGWHRNYLILGLPLLAALTPDQFRAVLAHEFGHLSRAHARFTNWIYRVRRTWAQVATTVAQQRSALGAILVNRFVQWYAPYFSAYSFVLARAHEYEADGTSAAVVGRATAASALVAVAVRGRYAREHLWTRVTARAVDEPEPPRAAFAGMVREMPAEVPRDAAGAWVAAALREQADVSDSHPALSARLAALGALPEDPAEVAALVEQVAHPIDPAGTAAERYLGALAARAAEELDEQWRNAVAARWRDHHRHLTQARDGLRELAAIAATRPLTADERFHQADWTEDVEGSDAALPLVAALVEDAPRHASACFMLGRILLARGDDAGTAYLERVMEIDPEAIAPAAALVAAHLRRTGRAQDGIAFDARAEAAAAEAAATAAERQSFAPGDRAAPAELDESVRARLREQLARYPEVGRAWLARKVTTHAPGRPFYVLGIARAEPWWRSVSEGSNNYLVRKLVEELALPGETLVFVLTRKRRALKRTLRRVPNAEIYRR